MQLKLLMKTTKSNSGCCGQKSRSVRYRVVVVNLVPKDSSTLSSHYEIIGYPDYQFRDIKSVSKGYKDTVAMAKIEGIWKGTVDGLGLKKHPEFINTIKISGMRDILL